MPFIMTYTHLYLRLVQWVREKSDECVDRWSRFEARRDSLVSFALNRKDVIARFWTLIEEDEANGWEANKFKCTNVFVNLQNVIAG
jgi:hypothetical protein